MNHCHHDRGVVPLPMLGIFLIYLGILTLVYAAARIVTGWLLPRHLTSRADQFLATCLMLYARVSTAVTALAVIGLLTYAITR